MTGIANRVDEKKPVVTAQTLLVKSDGTEQKTCRELLAEHRLELVVNEQTIARLVCTPEALEDLVVGRLITEGIVANVSEIESLYLCDSGNRARVFLKKDLSLCRVLGEEPTCCTDNRVLLQPETVREFQPVQPAIWTKEWIFHIVDAFSGDSALHKTTGGTHSCVLAVEGEIVYVAEDIGRHNAMDKAIGYGAGQNIAPEKCILFTTGRVPVDMVRKVLAAGIPVLVSKAVPTRDAVELAGQYGLTLICRAWPDSFEVFAG